jgi:multicomponent Na+:H+ antiporter subunit G
VDHELLQTLTSLLAYAFIAIGSAFILIGGIGVLRMPEIYTRMHASSVTETAGSLFVLIGLMILSGLSLATVKLFAIALFLLFTSPVSTYALVNTALITGQKPAVVKNHAGGASA